VFCVLNSAFSIVIISVPLHVNTADIKMRLHRKTAPKVKHGKVQSKNRLGITNNYWDFRQDSLQIDLEKPGKGFKHFLKKRDVIQFLELLPNWEEIDIELDAILLAEGGDCDGWYEDGVVGICAWEKDMTSVMDVEYFIEHKHILKRLGVQSEKKGDDVFCHFTESQIKAFQLLHIFLHELGHHHDRINTKTKEQIGRGEPYAEAYAGKYEKIIWDRYFDVFGF